MFEKPIRPARTRTLLLANVWQMITRRRSYADLIKLPEIPVGEVVRPRSIPLRHLDCGSCGGCELSLMRLESPVLDIRKYNIGFEAAARGAYFLVATGPWTRNSIEAAIANLRGMPIPGVIAFGDCATGKSPFRHSYAVNEKARKWLKSFGFIVHEVEGCPPNPFLAERKLLAIDMQDLTRR